MSPTASYTPQNHYGKRVGYTKHTRTRPWWTWLVAAGLGALIGAVIGLSI